MTAISEAAVLDALRTVQEPELGGDLVTRNMVRDLAIDGSDVSFTIELTTPACPLKDQIESDCQHIPVARKDFEKMSTFGKQRLRTAVLISK